MDKKRCGGPANNPDLQNSLSTNVRTVDGMEEVHVDMETGAVTYGNPKKVEKKKAQMEAKKTSGSEV